jgi:choline monooxygenase
VVPDCQISATEFATWHFLRSSLLDSADAPYGRGEVLYCWRWPNTMLNCLPGCQQTDHVMHLGTGCCRVVFDFFYAPGEVHRAAADVKFSEEVQQEDMRARKTVQRGPASGSDAGRARPAERVRGVDVSGLVSGSSLELGTRL